ncbi:prenyltransferase [Novipirellula aureliae]|uniref:Prenyltransferase n=1 Tax=Novipirellula aureliae TaxID=2527966 RepID=A0A5C6DLM5_9BACT|nr:hypothetical protein [Novipirellula aureliae]TWU36717.1 prenyltransferase [Novipirellula aureliae]
MQTANVTDEFTDDFDGNGVVEKPRVMLASFWRVIEVPNLIALDAPIVAICWQYWLSVTLSEKPKPLIHLLLFLTVWLVYIADRLLDCRRLDFQLDVPLRHQFANKWGWVLWPIWCGAFVFNGLLAILFVDSFLVIAGAILFSVVLFYGWVVHGRPTTGQWLPKEFFVAGLFSLGVCLPIFVSKNTLSTLVLTALLSWLFLLNCFCVAAAQRKSDQLQNIGSAIRLFPSLCSRIPLLAFLLVAAAMIANHADIVSYPITLAISISSVGLMLLSYAIDRANDWSKKTRYGLLADSALLSPLVVLVLYR